MAIATVAVGGKITATEQNAIVGGVNGIALNGIIPTSVAGTGVTVTPGGAVTFTNATSVSLNGVFTGTFDNYRITWTSTTRSSAATVNFRLRQSGVDLGGTGYDWVRLTTAGTTSTPTSSSAGSAAPLDNTVASGQRASGVVDIFGPALTSPMVATAFTSILSGSTLTAVQVSLANESATSADGFSVFLNVAGTWSGTIRVYGYNNLT